MIAGTAKALKVLHTADWHIGRMLYGKKRYAEFEAFLVWLSNTIVDQQIDVLVVAGDVFDNTAPSNRSQQIYYQFLCRVALSNCRHVIITAGNHDSATFLDAPKELLKALHVHVVGSITEMCDDEVICLKDVAGNLELIVCAVPYLRDRDMRTVEAGESVEDKDRKLVEGIRRHYDDVCQRASELRDQSGKPVPIIATGHLFTVGGKTYEGDGVRDLYVGSLAALSASEFPECIDYLALGHLHVPHAVGGYNTRRYSGSPIPMGFGECGQQKSICVLTCEPDHLAVELVTIPTFHRLVRITGTREQIIRAVRELAALRESVWVEAVHEGNEPIGGLRSALNDMLSGTQVELLRIKEGIQIDSPMAQLHDEETLFELDHEDVFARCLDSRKVAPEYLDELKLSYAEIVHSINTADTMAE